MRRLSPLLAVVLSIALTANADAALYWRSATVSVTADRQLQGLVQAEHLRVCPNRPLTPDSQLIWLARYRSQDMGIRRYFAHRTPEGRSVFDFMASLSIPRSGGSSEIIGWNTYSDDTAATVIFRMFMASTGHRAAIQRCRYTRVGAGSFKVGAKHYFTVLFTRP